MRYDFNDFLSSCLRTISKVLNNSTLDWISWTSMVNRKIHSYFATIFNLTLREEYLRESHITCRLLEGFLLLKIILSETESKAFVTRFSIIYDTYEIIKFFL